MSSGTQAQKVVNRYLDTITNTYKDSGQGATETTQLDVLAAVQSLGGVGEPIETLASSYVLNTGNLIGGTIASTNQVDGVYLTLGEDSSVGLSVDLLFIVSGGRKAENFNMVGRYQGGASHYVEVKAYNYTTLLYETVSTAINRLNNLTTDQTLTCPLTTAHTDSMGNCRIRLIHQTTTYNSAHRLYLDHVNVYYSVAGATKLQNTDNVLINPMTNEKGDEIVAAVNGISGTTPFNYIQSDTTATLKYYGYASSTGWKIKRKTLATGVWEVASATGDYATAWSDRAAKTYNYV